MNTQRKFDKLQKEQLGKYIYALRDPRDRKIFYIGQGSDDRVFNHFDAADNCLKSLKPFDQLSSKDIRILDIWKHNEDVDWLILAHNLPNSSGNDENVKSNLADYVESAIVDALSESQNGETLNEINPPNSSLLLPGDLEAMSAEFVNPQEPHKYVFVFYIGKTLKKGISAYDPTRSAWFVSDYYRNLELSYAVGIEQSISKGSYEIEKWHIVPGKPKLYEFSSPGDPNPAIYQPFYNKNWTNVVAMAKGYFQRGNYLIVEFDGNGKFRIVRGSRDTSSWHDCV